MHARPWQPGEARPAETVPASEFVGISDIVAFIRRYLVSILVCATAGAVAALFAILTTDPTYTTSAQILIEPKLPQYLQQQAAVSTSLDTAQIESQITVMRSEKITQMVIDELGLMDNPDFFILREPSFPERLGRFARAILSKLGLAPEPGPAGDAPAPPAEPPAALSDFERGRIAIDLFGANIDIRRVGVSYAVEISFRSRNPRLAADIVNATAAAFVREQIETKAAQARQGGEWLEQRMSEMREKMNTATQIAQQFRARHDYRVKPPGARLVDGQIVRDESQAAEDDQPTLEELEVTADTYRQLYESFLRAFTDNLSQQSYPVADARVITAATRPLSPSHPRKKLVLVFGLFAGVAAGVGQALLRDLTDRSIRTPRQIEEQLRVRCLAVLPGRGGWRGRPRRPDEAVAAPREAFGESLRRVRLALRREGGGKIRAIGIASALPGEEKSLIACNLAVLDAASGLRALLVDADDDAAALTRRLLGPEAPRSGIVPGALPGVDFLPGPMPEAALGPAVLRSDAHDVAVVDLPPLAAGIERLALAGRLDAVILVVEWGRSTFEATEELLAMLRAQDAPVFGVILDQARYLSPRPRSLFRARG